MTNKNTNNAYSDRNDRINNASAEEIRYERVFRLYEDYAPVLTTADVCQMINCCDKTVFKLVREGAIHPLKNFGRSYRFTKSDIIAYLAS